MSDEEEEDDSASEEDDKVKIVQGGPSKTNSRLAQKLNKKGLRSYGFKSSMKHGQNPKKPADKNEEAADKKSGLKRSHYPNKTYVHVKMNLHGGEDGAKITTEVVGN